MRLLKFSSSFIASLAASACFYTAGAMADNNMLLNSDFSDGWNGWSAWQASGTDATASINNEAARYDVIEGGTDFWQLQLNQAGMLIEQGKTYELSFETNMVGAFTDGLVGVVVEESDYPYTHYMQKQTVIAEQATENGQHTYTFTMGHPTDGNARVNFFFGDNDGSSPFPRSILVDNVSLREVAPNLISNADFTSGLAGWSQYIHHTADATISHSVYDDARARIVEGGSESWHVQLTQAGLNIEQGKTYSLSFSATTASRSANGIIDVIVEENGGNYTHYMPVDTVIANPSGQRFSFEFTMNYASDDDARLTFNLGKNDGPAPGPATVVIIDNIELVEVQ